MPVAYKKLYVMYPPRPKGAIHPDKLEDFPGWWAQRKFNGTRSLVFVDPDGGISFYDRHAEKQKAYEATSAMEKALSKLRLKRGLWYVLDGELLNNKTTGVKDRLVLFDVLVHESKYLTNTSYRDRLPLLKKLTKDPTEHESETGRKVALKVNSNVWLAETFEPKSGKEARQLFDDLLDMDEIEGLVLKDPGGTLQPGVREENNGGWLIRVRKPHKNYAY
jgi:ATP-dependent DNA ligase